ncbi:MAG: DeoR family transcriptional regulator [Candidatus Paceibacterota bacterium]|jgi:hypothetical protein
MRHGELSKGHSTEVQNVPKDGKYGVGEDFVLEKSIFNNIFEKDIRRVFIYKKVERLAKALHMIAPAFAESESLRNRIDMIAIGLVDAAVLPPSTTRAALSRELLLLSSFLGVARTGGLLSIMNADLIVREVHALLKEVAVYEEPRLSFDDTPTLATIAKDAQKRYSCHDSHAAANTHAAPNRTRKLSEVASGKGHVKDIRDIASSPVKDRQEAVLSVIRSKGSVSIKDISTMVRGVSEKTIQRELAALVASGVVLKQGERRWSTYSLL